MQPEGSRKLGTTTDGPRPISNKVVHISITGYLMPVYEDRQPVLLGMPGTDDLFICIFSEEEKLRSVMAELHIFFHKIVVIMDGPIFLESIKEDIAAQKRPYELRIAVDPYKVPETGRVRFQEIWIGEN